MNLSKGITAKIINQKDGINNSSMATALPLMKNVLTPLAKNVLLPLAVTTATLVTDGAI